MRTDLPDVEPSGGDAPVSISREDLLALEAAYRQVSRPAEVAGSVGVIGGLAIGAALLLLRGMLAWPPALDPIFFATGWAIALASAGLAWRRQRRALASYQFSCPVCDLPMLTVQRWRSEISRAQLAASTGHCPRCASKILD